VSGAVNREISCVSGGNCEINKQLDKGVTSGCQRESNCGPGW